MKNKLNLGLLSICTLSMANSALAQSVTGNIVIEDGKIRIVGVGINVPGPTHGHPPRDHRNPRPVPPIYQPSYDDRLDPREAELIIRSCSAQNYWESQARCYSDNLLRNPSQGFQRIGRASAAGSYDSDKAKGAKAALEVIASNRTNSNVLLSAILSGCNAMNYWDSQAKCFTAGTVNSSEAMTVLRAGAMAGSYDSDIAKSFKAGISSRLAGNGPISTLKAACEAAQYWESQSKCFAAGSNHIRDFQAQVVLNSAKKGSYDSDKAKGSKAGLSARIQNQNMSQIILATCSSMSYYDSQARCYASAGAQMRGFDPLIDRLLASCQRGSYDSDIAKCSANVLKNM